MKKLLAIRAFLHLVPLKRRLQHLCLLLSLWLVTGSVHATDYISEIATARWEYSEWFTGKAAYELTKNRFAFDLELMNIDPSSTLYNTTLGYKTTTNIKDAITGLLISERQDASITYNGCTYYQCKRYGNDGVINSGGNCTKRYLYYTKDKWAENGAITKLGFHNLNGAKSSSNYVKGYNRNRQIVDSQDLYQGQGSSTYLYISFEKYYTEDAIYPFKLKQNVCCYYPRNDIGVGDWHSTFAITKCNRTFNDYWLSTEPSLMTYGWFKQNGSSAIDLIRSLFEAKVKVPAYCTLSFNADVEIWGSSTTHYFNAAVYHDPEYNNNYDKFLRTNCKNTPMGCSL